MYLCMPVDFMVSPEQLWGTLRPGSVALCDLDGSRAPPLVLCGLQLIGVGGTSRVLDIIRTNTGVGMCCLPSCATLVFITKIRTLKCIVSPRRQEFHDIRI